MSYEAIPAATRDDPTRYAGWLDTMEVHDLVGMAEAGYFAPDSMPSGPRKSAVIHALQARHEQRTLHEALTRIDASGAAVVHVLPGVDNVEAAIADLTLTQHEALAAIGRETPDWELHGDVLYVRDVPTGEVRQALIRTRG